MQIRKNRLLLIFLVAITILFSGFIFGDTIAKLTTQKPNYAVNFAYELADEINHFTNLPVQVTDLSQISKNNLKNALNTSNFTNCQKAVTNNPKKVFGIGGQPAAFEICLSEDSKNMTILLYGKMLSEDNRMKTQNIIKASRTFGKMPTENLASLRHLNVNISEMHLETLSPYSQGKPNLEKFHNDLRIFFLPWKAQMPFSNPEYINWLRKALNSNFFRVRMGCWFSGFFLGIAGIGFTAESLKQLFSSWKDNLGEALNLVKPKWLFWKFCFGNSDKLESSICQNAKAIKKAKDQIYEIERSHRLANRQLENLARYLDDDAPEIQEVFAAIQNKSSLEDKSRLHDKLQIIIEQRFLVQPPPVMYWPEVYVPKIHKQEESTEPASEPKKEPSPTVYLSLEDMLNVLLSEAEITPLVPEGINATTVRYILIMLVRERHFAGKYGKFATFKDNVVKLHDINGQTFSEREFRDCLSWMYRYGVLVKHTKQPHDTYSISSKSSDGMTAEAQRLIRLAVSCRHSLQLAS